MAVSAHAIVDCSMAQCRQDLLATLWRPTATSLREQVKCPGAKQEFVQCLVIGRCASPSRTNDEHRGIS